MKLGSFSSIPTRKEIDSLKVLFFGLLTHINNPFVGLPFNMSQRFRLNRCWVTFNLSQLGVEITI